MGSLKPGATYIYENANGVTYRREFGKQDRHEMGWDYHDTRTSDGRPLHDHIMEDQMWGEIRRMAKINPTLHDALERAIVIYKLSKTNE